MSKEFHIVENFPIAFNREIIRLDNAILGKNVGLGFITRDDVKLYVLKLNEHDTWQFVKDGIVDGVENINCMQRIMQEYILPHVSKHIASKGELNASK